MSLLSVSAEVRKWIYAVALALVGITVISLSAGPCSRKEPKVQPVKEGHVDQGKSEIAPAPAIPGGAPEPVYVPVPAVPLRPEQIVAEARKLGMIFLTPEQAVEEGVKPGELVSGEFTLFAKESFGPGPCGDVLTAFAWQGAAGEPIDLVGQWADYQPPALKPQRAPLFTNESRWHFWGGPALLISEDGSGLGLAGGADYTGFRLWKLQSEFHGAVGHSEETGAQGFVSLALGF